MLDPDISTAAALRHLSQPDTDEWAVDRRRFLQLVGMGVGAGVAAGSGSSLLESLLTGNEPWAHGAGPVGATDGILVILGMFGGNDGLNMVVPTNDSAYQVQRPNIAISAADTLPLDAANGLNKELTEFKRFWDAGHLAVVQGVGYPNPDLSHFNSMATWMSGITGGIPSSGWMGRWLDGHLGSTKNLFAAAEIGHSLPLHLIGQVQRGTTVPAGRPAFGADTSAQAQRLYSSLRTISAPNGTTWKGRVGQAIVDQLDVASTLRPIIPETLPTESSSARLEVMARLINANLGFRVFTAGWGDFDSHANEPAMHTSRMAELNAAVKRFYEVLSPAWVDRVTVMTFSEFGRTSWSNDGRGTDHGTAAPHLVFGGRVRGGLYGQRPALQGLKRWDRMAYHVDFRDYYGSVIDGWMGGGGSDVVRKPVADLALFLPPDAPVTPLVPVVTAPAPGAGGGQGGVGTSGFGRFVALNPQRVFDTRVGVGGRLGAIAADESVDVQITGQGGVPDGALSVALNVTSVNATESTFFSAFPAGLSVPDSSSLNPQPGRAIPNMVLVGIGAGGAISIFNKFGQADCIVDVLGYFHPTDGCGLEPLVPDRLLDTRVGIGAPVGRVGAGSTIELQVTGRGGVPANEVDAVVLNLTSVMPSSAGFLTSWPTGQTQPYISNVNYEPGRVIPNLVLCKVGDGGRVSIYVSDGDVDLIADVVGCFTEAGAAHSPVVPMRVLDTRTGLGAPIGPVGPNGELAVQVVGHAGVPASAQAVVLNVTATNATADTYISSYPSGAGRPNASSLNVSAGRTAANLVLAKLGPDGAVRLFNESGSVDLLADVTGYFV
jgi:uncharacterized protein (DUF1501 family)